MENGRSASKFFKAFNKLFDIFTEFYGRTIGRLVRLCVIVLLVYGGLLLLTGWTINKAPKAFIPEQDQGYLLVNVQLPDSASVQRTQKVMAQVDRIVLGDPSDSKNYPHVPGVAHTLSVVCERTSTRAPAARMASAGPRTVTDAPITANLPKRRHGSDRHPIHR